MILCVYSIHRLEVVADHTECMACVAVVKHLSSGQTIISVICAA